MAETLEMHSSGRGEEQVSNAPLEYAGVYSGLHYY